MARNIVPRTDKGADLGTTEKRWNRVYADAVIATNVQGGNLGAVEQSAGTEAALRSIITEVGNNPVTITIYDDIPIVATDLTIPSNVRLNFKDNGRLSPANGITVILDCAIYAGPWQIFGGNGIFEGNPQISEAYPEWFGAVGDNINDDADAVQAALNFHNVVKFSNKTYKINDTVTINKDGTKILGPTTINTDEAIVFKASGKNNLEFRELNITSSYDAMAYETLLNETTPDPNGYYKVDGVIQASYGNNITAIGCFVSGGYCGITFGYSNNVTIKDCEVTNGSHILVNCGCSSNVYIINNKIHDIAGKEIANRPSYLIETTGGLEEYQCKNVYIQDNILYGNPARDAIMSHRVTNINITGNTIYDVRCGIDLSNNDAVNQVKISNNIIEDTDEGDPTWYALNNAILIYNSGSGFNEDVVISDNTIKGFCKYPSSTGYCQIALLQVKNCVITGNNFTFPQETEHDSTGIVRMIGCENMVISSNNFRTDFTCINMAGEEIYPKALKNINIINNNLLKLNPEAQNQSFIFLSGTPEINNLNVDNNLGLLAGIGGAAIIDGVFFPTVHLPYYAPRKKWRFITEMEAQTIDANSSKRLTISGFGDLLYPLRTDIVVIPTFSIAVVNSGLIVSASGWDSGNIALKYVNVSASDITINSCSVCLSIVNYKD